VKQVFFLVHQEARRRAMAALADAPEGMRVTIEPKPRTLDQNSLLWVLLGEISRQVEWHGQKLTDHEWKDMATAALKRQKVVPGIEGGFVVLGSSTSRMSKTELSELIEFLYAFGAEHEVEFHEHTRQTA
jgi:hypothetical protein